MDEIMINRADVRMYSLIPNFALRFLSRRALKSMYDKTMIEAVGEYETPIAGGASLDFRSIKIATVNIEQEIERRGLEKKPLNPHEQTSRKLYASEIWREFH